MWVVRENFERLINVPDVPEFDLAVIPTADQVVLLVGVEVHISNQLTMGILYHIGLPKTTQQQATV